MLRALERLDDLQEDERFRQWFYAVMLSVHRARFRRAFWRHLVPLGDDYREPSSPSTTDAIDGADRMALALGSLSPEGREAIVLFELEGFSLEEVATLQGTSLSAVKSRLMRARTRLAAFYDRQTRVTAVTSSETRHEH